MRQIIEKLNVDVASLLSKKISEKQVRKVLMRVLNQAGYNVDKQIDFGRVLVGVQFDEFPRDSSMGVFYWLDVEKNGCEFVALFRPFIPFVYVIEKEEMLFDDYGYQAEEYFVLGYEVVAGSGALQKGGYLIRYVLECWIGLGFLWGGVSLYPRAIIESSIYLADLDDCKDKALNKVFASLLKENIPFRKEYKFSMDDVSVSELIKKLKF